MHFKKFSSLIGFKESIVYFKMKKHLATKASKFTSVDQLNYEFPNKFAHFCNFHLILRYTIDSLMVVSDMVKRI